MRIETEKIRTEDGRDIVFVFDIVDYNRKVTWRICDIMYKTTKQRNYRFLSLTFRDNFDYRLLDRNGKADYAMKKYIEFVGEDLIRTGIEMAWNSIKPDIDALVAFVH